jgi:hypothetical protein
MKFDYNYYEQDKKTTVMNQEKNLFQSLKDYLNQVYQESSCFANSPNHDFTQGVFTTSQMKTAMDGIEQSTWWKIHSNNEFYRTDTYRTYLKRCGFVENCLDENGKAIRGLWKVIKPIPKWFNSGHANFLLGFGQWTPKNGKSLTYDGHTKSEIYAQIDHDTHHPNGVSFYDLKTLAPKNPETPSTIVTNAKERIIVNTVVNKWPIGKSTVVEIDVELLKNLYTIVATSDSDFCKLGVTRLEAMYPKLFSGPIRIGDRFIHKATQEEYMIVNASCVATSKQLHIMFVNLKNGSMMSLKNKWPNLYNEGPCFLPNDETLTSELINLGVYDIFIKKTK